MRSLRIIAVLALLMSAVLTVFADDAPKFSKEQVQKIMQFQTESAALQKKQQEVQSVITSVCAPPKWQYALTPNADNSGYIPGCILAPPPPPQNVPK